MALASAPATPERSGAPQPIRRSFTAPTKSLRTPLALNESEVQGAETLFSHSSGKIVSFSTPASSFRRHSSVSDTRSEFQDEPVGTLPWASITERTMAAGPLQIYRVLGSVAFLNSGKTLQPLLAKSQCWCVDGVSKFVLRIRPHAYYRIELPNETPQDEERIEEIKKVLKNILQYETTPCPFKRGFTVDLPEPPKTPIQKKPWKPKVPVASSADELNDEVEPLETLDEEVSTEEYPEDLGVFREPSDDHNDETIASKSIFKSEPEPKDAPLVEQGSTKKAIDAINEKTAIQEDILEDEPPTFKTPTRPKPLRGSRTVTAPPQLSLRTTPPSTSAMAHVSSNVGPNRKVSSFTSSVESFHSFHSPISPLPPSPPSSGSSPESYPPTNIDVAKTRRHRRDPSEVTVTASKNELWDLTDASADEETEYHSPPDLPQTATLIKEAVSSDMDQGSSNTDSSDARARLRNTRKSRQRNHSPLPSSSNLYSPYSPRAHISGHHLTTAILQRTCSLLLGPPVQLVALMLRIAAKITQGVFHGTAIGFNNEGQRIPCSWDFSDGSGDDESDSRSEDEEDDYGVSLGKTVSGKDVRTKDFGGSWEID